MRKDGPDGKRDSRRRRTRDEVDPIARWEVQVRKGSLDLAILASLWSGKLYGLEILKRIESDSSLLVPEGTVYPLLARLKEEGWVDAEWVEAEAGHPRKYYRLTAAGRRHLVKMAHAWSRFAASLDRLLVPVKKEDH
jgi:PadR family transcriptional regulator PadR